MQRYDTTEGVLAAEKISNSVVEALQPFTESKHVEVQERAVLARSVLLQCTLCRRTAKEERKRMLLKKKEREEEMKRKRGFNLHDEIEDEIEEDDEEEEKEDEEDEEDEEPMLEFVPTKQMLDDVIDMIGPMFEEPLRPVNAKAQEMVREYCSISFGLVLASFVLSFCTVNLTDVNVSWTLFVFFFVVTNTSQTTLGTNTRGIES